LFSCGYRRIDECLPCDYYCPCATYFCLVVTSALTPTRLKEGGDSGDNNNNNSNNNSNTPVATADQEVEQQQEAQRQGQMTTTESEMELWG